MSALPEWNSGHTYLDGRYWPSRMKPEPAPVMPQYFSVRGIEAQRAVEGTRPMFEWLREYVEVRGTDVLKEWCEAGDWIARDEAGNIYRLSDAEMIRIIQEIKGVGRMLEAGKQDS